MLPARGRTDRRRTCEGGTEGGEFSLSAVFSSIEVERKESEISCVLVDGSVSTVGRTVARLIALIRRGGGAARAGVEGEGCIDRRDGVRDIPIAG